jgi:hypothetical protein
MAQRPITASAMEGIERVRTRRRKLRALGISETKRPTMGDLAQGVLAHRRIQSPRRRPAQRLLDRTRPAGIPRPLPPLPGRDANRRMRTRTSGGVGGARVSPRLPDQIRHSPSPELHRSRCLLPRANAAMWFRRQKPTSDRPPRLSADDRFQHPIAVERVIASPTAEVRRQLGLTSALPPGCVL